MKLGKQDRVFLSREYNRIFLIPTIQISYDIFFEGGLIYLDVEISWLRWSLCFRVIKDK